MQQHAPRTAPIIQGDFSCGLQRGAGCVVPSGRPVDTEPIAPDAPYFVLTGSNSVKKRAYASDNDECEIITPGEKERGRKSLFREGDAHVGTSRATNAQCVNRYRGMVVFLNAAFISYRETSSLSLSVRRRRLSTSLRRKSETGRSLSDRDILVTD